jgi:hypothetical protein
MMGGSHTWYITTKNLWEYQKIENVRGMEEGRGEKGTGILRLGESQVVLDPMTDHTFAFDAATGKSSWIVSVVEGGEVALELLY